MEEILYTYTCEQLKRKALTLREAMKIARPILWEQRTLVFAIRDGKVSGNLEAETEKLQRLGKEFRSLTNELIDVRLTIKELGC